MKQHRFGGGYEPEPTPTWMYWVAGLCVVVAVVILMGWAQFIHGDWRCAFAQCRIETK